MKIYRFIAPVLLVFAQSVFAQVTYPPVTLAFPQIAIGGDAAAENYITLVQIVNNNSAPTTGRVTLYSDSGTALSALFNGQGPQSTIDITLASGEAREVQLTLAGPVTTGWMAITYSPSDALTTLILQFRSGTSVVSEVGVDPAAETIAATDFAAETDATLNTGVAIANPSNAAAYVLATLWDSAAGTAAARSVISLPANGHIARFLTELFPDTTNISQIRAKISLDSCSTSACNLAGGNGLIATAIRLNGDQFTTIPIIDRPDGGDPVRILPQVAFGGSSSGLSMKTVLYFTTNVSSGVFGTARIFDNDGNPLLASADGAAPSSSITVTVAGNRVSRIVLSGDSTLRSGWIRLEMSAPTHLIANAVFQTFNGPNVVSEASVLESTPINRGLIYVKTQSQAANVGIALANSESTSNNITLNLFDRAGFLAASREVVLPPNGHIAQFVTELFPQVAAQPAFDGALSIQSATPFSALALRLNSDKVATLPVATNGMYRPSVTGLRVTSTQRTPAQINFSVDITDFDSDIATSASTSITAAAVVDFGSSGYDFGPVTIDGTALLNRTNGTVSGVFQPPRVTGTVPTGQSAVLYILIYDSATNASNIAGLPFRF